MCRDGRGLGSKLVSFTKGFSKHPNILAIFKVHSEYLMFPFKAKVDYFILHSILVYSFVIFLIFFAMNKRRRTNEVYQMIFTSQRYIPRAATLGKQVISWTCAVRYSALSCLSGTKRHILCTANQSNAKLYKRFAQRKRISGNFGKGN